MERCPIVQYEFTLPGGIYKSDRITWGNVHVPGADDASQRVVDNYSEGAEVNVFYNPENASESVMEPGPVQGARFSLAACCIPVIVQRMTGFLKVP